MRHEPTTIKQFFFQIEHNIAIKKPILEYYIKNTMGYDLYKKQRKLADEEYHADAHKLFDGMTSIIKRKNYTHNDNVYK